MSNTQDLGKYIPQVRAAGIRLKSSEPIVSAGTNTFSGSNTFSGVLSSTAANGTVNAQINTHSPVAINATATATATQVITGYITSTSAAATTITLPTATLLGTALGAVQGTVFDLYIDNTAGANTVTIVAGTGMTASTVAQVATYGVPTFGLLTVASGTSGTGVFRFVFSSATACTYTRIA